MRPEVIQGDVREVLKTLDDKSVQCVVTSPPYWGLRDYGVDDQLGLEATPEEFVENMVDVFREVKRVLRNDGTLWLNLGDTFFNKNLLGMPWRVALALQADGWYLRSDIIWNKPNPMPEPVKDRPTKAHEYIFLLTKSAKYYYDAEAIKENGEYPAGTKAAKGSAKRYSTDLVNSRPPEYKVYDGLRNKRSVWRITTKPYKGAHFATFPEELPETCIKAGTQKGDVVLDIFAGSGTTLRVASKLGRKVIGIELNPEYIKILKKRCKIESMSLEAFI
jgi:DNA modification methylase